MSDDKIAGFIPKSKYVQITYTLLMVAAAGSLVMSLLGFAGITLVLTLGKLFSLAGLIGLIMAICGAFVFKGDLSELDGSHMFYVTVMFAVLFILGMVLGTVLGGSFMLAMLIGLVLAGLELVLLFTGFNSWKHGRAVTKENLKGEVQLALKRA
jgi:hypothetical protein